MSKLEFELSHRSIGAPVFFEDNNREEVDWFWEQLKNRVTVIEPIHATPWGTRKFTIADPDGNELGFCKPGNI